MAQSVHGSAFDPLMVARRGSPNLHLDFGRRWQLAVEENGYHYIGDTLTRSSYRVPTHRLERVLGINAGGAPRVWRNRCLHNGRILAQPSLDGLPVVVAPGQTIRCDWHHATYQPENGRLIRLGAMPIPVDGLPEAQCRDFEKIVWQDRIVFELGRSGATARQELEEVLQFIDATTNGLFDLRDYRLRCTLVSPQDADLLMTLANYLDIRHVANHRGTLAPLVDLRSYSHRMSPGRNVAFQHMAAHPSWLEGSHPLAAHLRIDGVPAAAQKDIAWITTGTGLMIERYQGVIVISVGLPDPKDPWRCILHHDFYYHERMSAEAIALHQKLFYDTGIEDEVWCHDGTTFCQAEITEGRGDDAWGLIDPAEENYAPWFYDLARKRLAALSD